MSCNYKLILNIEKDIKNRFDWCNKISHWYNRQKNIKRDHYPLDIFDIVDYLKQESYENSINILTPFLWKIYKEEKKIIERILNMRNKKFDKEFKEACVCLENITQKPLYIKEYTFFLTTFPRQPYNYKKWYIWLYIFWNVNWFLWTFLHEALHFQTIFYYKDYILKKWLDENQFEFFKEALTVILNIEAKEFLCKEDCWYKLHYDLRQKLRKFWEEGDQDFKKLIDFWISCFSK